jgi:murein L,D-transpeptidase YcbB/YkuD
VVDRAMKKNNMSKAQLDAALESCGLYCHRKDHELGNESWHYNALGPDAQQWLRFASANSTSRAVEAKLMSVYSAQMVLTQQEVAQCLAQLKYKAVKEFQADWDLQADGIAGPVTQRLLAYLSAEIVLVS